MQGPPEHQLVLPLLVLICQQRDATEVMSGAKDIKFISERYDTCQASLLQASSYFALQHEGCGVWGLVRRA